MDNKVEINAVCSQVVNFAMQQNHIPMVRQLFIKNIGKEELHDLTVTINVDPVFAMDWKTDVSSVAPEQTIEVKHVDIRLSVAYLCNMTERMNGSIFITVKHQDEIIAQHIQDIGILAYDEWSGGNIIPEIISAFVTPNHPYITEIIKNASQLLQKWEGDPSFTGYQRKNPNAVRKQMAAIYGAIQKENIAYCMPPASFEKSGQRVRLCDAIKEQKLGTCLDLTLLYVGCMEAVGLHPLIVICQGHAFAGCWLEEESFSECVQDDVSMLTKRIATGINEICLVECTCFVADKNVEFKDAVWTAEHNNLSNIEEFVYFVDIKRCRGSKIRPIPMMRKMSEDGSYTFQCNELENHVCITNAPDEIEVMDKIQPVKQIEFSRQQLWERKLLDLSMRNTLLNFRVNKNCLQLLSNSLPQLEDALSSGEEFQIMNCPEDFKNSFRDNKIFETENNESMVDALVKTEFASHRIRTFIDEPTLETIMTGLYRTAKTSLEENGANTMYLALGFLKWYESDLSEQARYAPLVMIPIEIVRKSVRKGYIIRIREEEPQFNITLLEMLRADFGITIGGLEPLPTDDSGINLKLVFNIMRQAVMGKSRWDVQELAFIGIFSFSQFIMWNDIRNRADELKKNKVVASLMSGKMEWQTTETFPSPETLDDTVSPLDMAVPVSADSSQMTAICAAGKGNTFVLHGPPGTGKSQTITNMIANALYQGKSVLFIAEKMAALSVVERRLGSIGLEPFCLELHSNKAKKKDLFDKLDKTLNIGQIKNPEMYTEQAERLHSLRSQLNDVVNAIHKQQPYGFSLYDTIVRAEQYKECKADITFTEEQIHTLTPQKYTEWVDICGQIEAIAKACGGIYDNKLREFANPQYSQMLKSNIGLVLTESITIFENLKKSIGTCADGFKLGKISTFKQVAALVTLSGVLNEISLMPNGILESKELTLLADKISDICAIGKRRDEIQAQLLEDFSEQILTFDCIQAEIQWQQAENSWFMPKLLTQGKLAKTLKSYSLKPNTYAKENTPSVLAMIKEYQAKSKAIDENSTMFIPLYGVVWNNGKCYWEQIQTIYTQAMKIQQSIASSAENLENREMAMNIIKQAMLDGATNYKDSHKLLLNEIIDGFQKIIDKETILTEYFKADYTRWHTQQDWLQTMVERMTRWNHNLEGLRDWCSYLQIRQQAVDLGLASLIDALENGKITEPDILPTFYHNISQACALVIVSEDKALSTFNGNLFEQEIKKYKDICNEFENLTCQELVARLSTNVPVLLSGISDSSEIGILQRAIRSGGRAMSVRKLFDNIPNLLRKLCPCMLMSPISVAQYIDPKYPPFDLVIFDEASQLPTCKAVGAIARGENLIVVGDPKQLPPTSFFATNNVDEENFDKEDLESVLDDCLALSIPQEHLLWHYRSKHESLIAFSNRQYYENKLYTFPSPNDMISEVKYISVEGYYDRGKTKQNKAEAEAVVKEIVRRLRDPELSKLSMGVVTFSVVQQHLIEDMIDEEFAKCPELEEINNKAYEQLFVKNLENVQGDERDVIMFSVGYGPDINGNVALNFGPLNRDGGWRRLNVAVSRARRQMLVFSVLKPEQIDLSKTGADGIAGLKAFLKFAINGKSALTSTQTNVKEKHGIEEIIAEKLRQQGIEVATNIGCSEYKIDIGVVNPNKHGEYILGIMCDGDRYRRSGTARDRNILQESVLKSLGWNVHRIWILDWWENSNKELARIKQAIDYAIANDNTQPCVEEMPIASMEATQYERVEAKEDTVCLPTYVLCELEAESGLFGNSEEFANPCRASHIKDQILQVLNVEAPISRNALCKRVLDAWGITRMGSRIDKTFVGILKSMNLPQTKNDEIIYYWNVTQDIQNYSEFRIPTSEEKTRRNMEDIPQEEIANAILYVIKRQYSLETEDLIREVATLFGFSRCTASIQSIIKTAVVKAIQMGYANADGNRVSQ